MKLRRLFVAVLTVLSTALMVAQDMSQLPQIPVDPDVRIGKLDNGLTYYIRHNAWPEHRAEFYIAQRVGSIQEDDNQRGLAHFLEHMAFNGSKHFKGDEMLRWCESVGVKFGTDLNAYTSIDQTVYNISNVPTTREGIIDSCLLILFDWADGLLLEKEEIEKERGVIHEEWRLRTSAQMRMLERDLPKLYPGSKYGHRMPIGLMEIIDNFEPPFLQAYYEKWYRPDNQAIIVVGDFDVDSVEQKIKTLFSPIVLPENRALVTTYPVPDNDEAIYIIDKDKEQQYNIIDVLMKTEAFPDSLKGSLAYLAALYVKDAAVSMLNDRLREYAEKPESPFLQASAGFGPYLLSRTVDAFELGILPKEGQYDSALTAVITEARRAAEFGFTATEYSRFKANYLSNLEKTYSNKDKRYNRQFVNSYVQNFLNNEPIPSIDFTYQTMKQVVPLLPLEMANEVIKELVLPTDTNLVVLNFNNEKEGAVYPTEEGLKKAVDAGRTAKIEAYVDNVKDEPLMTTLPEPGTIKKEKKDRFGFTELTLSNGVKVVLKQTDLKKDQVLLEGYGYGGSGLYDIVELPNLNMFNDVISASGLGNFSHTELEKALAGKIASASLSLSAYREQVNGSSTPKDVETMLQLVYLYMTSINKDQKSFDNLMQTSEVALKNRLLQPENVFSDSLRLTLGNHGPRSKAFDLDDLKKVDYDRILQIAKERTANAAAFTFDIIGNYDEATIRPLICQYLGSLPSQKKVEKSKCISEDFTGNVVNSFKHKAETPKAIAVMFWYSKQMPFNLENSVKASIAGQILSMEYLKKIRENASAAYTCGASASVSKDDFEQSSSIYVYCPMKPEKADTALMIMRDEVNAMAAGTCDADKLAKVKEYLLKNHADQLKQNGYWLGQINAWRYHGIDFHTDYEKVVNAQTPESICAFVKEVLKAGNRAEVVMMPAE